MSDSFESNAPGWLLLLHHLPPKPDYFRVRVRRQLHQLGAIGLKNAAYLLPLSNQARADFESLARQIRNDGGEAVIAVADFVSGVTSEELIERFRQQSDAAYAELVTSARASGEVRPDALARLERQWELIAQRDAFMAPSRSAARAALNELRRYAEARASLSGRPELPSGATWVTRQGVSVDAIGAAWLVVRFIDRSARFKFAPAKGYRPSQGEVRFSMADAEFAPEPGRVSTFQRLVYHFGLAGDPALIRLAELVHDLVFDDRGHQRPESAGLGALIQGVVARYGADAERLEHGRRLFDQLYTHFTRVSVQSQSPPAKEEADPR